LISPERLLLALRAGQVVPTGTLIDELWGERLPADAANALACVPVMPALCGGALIRQQCAADTPLTGHTLRGPRA